MLEGKRGMVLHPALSHMDSSMHAVWFWMTVLMGVEKKGVICADASQR